MNKGYLYEYPSGMWKLRCIWRHCSLTFFWLNQGLFLWIFTILISPYRSGVFLLFEPTFFMRHSMLLVALILICLLTFSVTLLTNIRLYRLFESNKTMVVTSSNGQAVEYNVLHMAVSDIVNTRGEREQIPLFLPYFDPFFKSTLRPHWMNCIIYLQHPETGEIYAYCRNCHNLIRIEDLCNECPHCHSYVSYEGPQ